MDKDLWLFDYSHGTAYEAFSQSEDAYHLIDSYLLENYDLNGKTILEIGAGSGRFTSTLAKSCQRLYVVEKSKNLMDINLGKNAHLNNAEFILADIKDLKLPPNSVDIIFAGWSLTSMRSLFDIIFNNFQRILRNDGIIIAIENAGGDEFTNIVGIDDFTTTITKVYMDMGFINKKTITTTIELPHKKVFHNAFPDKCDVELSSLNIQHKVLVLEMSAADLQYIRR